MTANALEVPDRLASPGVAELFRREPLYAGAALCLAALIAPTLFAMTLDQRTLLGSNVWVKPLRFEIALVVYLATLAWFAGWLPQGVTNTRWYRSTPRRSSSPLQRKLSGSAEPRPSASRPTSMKHHLS